MGLVVRSREGPARSDPLGRFFLAVMAPLQGLAAAIGRAVGGTWHGAADLFRANGENAVLREHVRRLEEERDRLLETQIENERLRGLLDFRQTLVGEVLTARVIGHDATGTARTIVIDRGEHDGVTKGAAVLAREGIVGQVFLAGPDSARVLLLSDHNSGVDAIVQRTRARGIVQGTVDGGCALKWVMRTEDVQLGDALVTSGFDGIFPKGLPIGQVTAVDKRGQLLFQNIEVAPRVAVDRLEEVLVTRGPVAPAPPDAPRAPAE
jgi:rod shape-determining protein MreC